MPLCARSSWATSDFNAWWYAQMINQFRAGTRSMWIPPRVQWPGAPNGTIPLRSST